MFITNPVNRRYEKNASTAIQKRPIGEAINAPTVPPILLLPNQVAKADGSREASGSVGIRFAAVAGGLNELLEPPKLRAAAEKARLGAASKVLNLSERTSLSKESSDGTEITVESLDDLMETTGVTQAVADIPTKFGREHARQGDDGGVEYIQIKQIHSQQKGQYRTQKEKTPPADAAARPSTEECVFQKHIVNERAAD